MQKTSLEKWVDELQAQIDQVKREVQSIPAPTPAPDPSYDAVQHGLADVVVGLDEYDDPTITTSIAVSLDAAHYDYFLSMTYRLRNTASSAPEYISDIVNMPIAQTAIRFPAMKVTYSAQTQTTTVTPYDLTVSITPTNAGIDIVFSCDSDFYPDAETLHSRYMITAVKKATNSRSKKKK